MGTIVVSIDAELAWGFHDMDPMPLDRVETARWGWYRLLELLERFELPATWAVVGHLFLDGCDGHHANHPSLAGWFRRDPGGTTATEREWYGPDLIEAIRDASVDHEIGSHTYSHVEFGRSAVTEEIAAAELEQSVELARLDGIDLDSLVFPRNNVGHRELLAEYGFRCYRGVEPDRWFDSRFRRAGKLLAYNLGRDPPPLVTPEVDEYGLVNIPASLYLFSLEGIAGEVSTSVLGDPVVRQARLGVDEAVRSDGVFHLWLHPNNILGPAAVERLERVFAHVRDRVDETDLRIETMRSVAKERTER
jgi:peptidoglycan/xylan/chitin deacetylase (PgdA/CDA1 family)